MKKVIIATIHTVALICGVYFYMTTVDSPLESSLVLQICFLYVFFVNTKHRHFLPALVLIFIVKTVELPISLHLFDTSFWLYVANLILFDSLLAFALYKWHQGGWLGNYLNVKAAPVRGGIPQVNGVLIVLCLAILQSVFLLIEVALYQAQILPPEFMFIYSSYQPVKIMLKLLELAAIWAMLIDSVYADENRVVKLLNHLNARGTRAKS